MYLLYCAEKFRLDLMNIARTTLSSKILLQNKEHFAKLAVDAVMKLKVNSDYATNNETTFSVCNVTMLFPLVHLWKNFS
jgi:chaperonin GroEL (HSP60 family)